MISKKILLYIFFLVVFLGAVFVVYSDDSIYLRVNVSIEEELRPSDTVLKFKGEVAKINVAEYGGKFHGQVDFYQETLRKIYAGESLAGLFLNGLDDKDKDFIDGLNRLKKRLVRHELIAIVDRGEEVVLFVKKRYRDLKFDPISFVRVVKVDSSYKLERLHELDPILKEMLNAGFYARKNKSEITFLGLLDVVKIEFSSCFFGRVVDVDNLGFLMFEREGRENRKLINLFEIEAFSLEDAFEFAIFSNDSKKVVLEWVERNGMSLDSMYLSQIFGQNLVFEKLYSLTKECQIYIFSRSGGGAKVFICDGLVSNVFLESMDNQIYLEI
ncbi:hypothetical protein [Pelagibaculum spongiae]|uniref:Uncharacterized protein n=1 Tax=Pelagibaculum spongiae TaxID=2080658 RepID=A0A2V1H5Q2_9GAMM|nr:hypothetical protein [Pelagibaculum spongiae]PVZ71752.1 hypothetical protein DC094_01620 [Pelagibaculum spongiae]